MAEEKTIEFPYERIAMAGGEMPADIEWYDRQIFLQLRMLYHQFKTGIIDRDAASREKKKLMSDYNTNKFMHEFTAGIAKKIMETDAARTAYRKNRTLENADAIILAFEGIPVDPKEGAL